MDAGALIYPFYPFLFLVLFFETFLLVTFVSKPAREARSRGPSIATPTVALVVPCYNEEETLGNTVDSLLALEYPKDKLEIILVDDGSKDRTLEVMRRYESDPRVRVIAQENGGKHTALNAGIAATNAEIFGCVDADTFLQPDALRLTLACFERPKVAAAMSAIDIHKPKNFFEHMQSAEYIMGIFVRHALCTMNAMYVTPGPFSLYRRSVLVEVGGFRYGQQTEDMEMALRLQKLHYEIDNVPLARVTTHAMDTLPKLIKQRMRWTSGFLRNVIYDYRDLMGNPRYGALGLIVLPMGILSPLITVGLFVLSAFLGIKSLVDLYVINRGIPLTFAMPSLDWFYTPTSFLTLLSLVNLAIAVALIVIGKRISRSPGELFGSFVGFAFLYGIVAPFWFFQATADVILGKRRGWR
jgi:biofilm PGA synthesis N-glycosyltransferase PgaC